MDNTKTCCFTGHRNIPKTDFFKIKSATKANILSLISNGIDTFICGGALGYDTLCAEIVIELKKKYPISLFLALPCKEQDKYFSLKDKIKYKKILSNADMVYYISETYNPFCMHKRNRFMVDNSSCLIAYCTKTSGGSYYTKSYALSNNLKILDVY